MSSTMQLNDKIESLAFSFDEENNESIKKLTELLELRIELERMRNDKRLSDGDTTFIRGKIEAYKSILALFNEDY